jgi:hypothetical protein
MHLPGDDKQGTRGNAARMHVPIGVASDEVWHTFFLFRLFFFLRGWRRLKELGAVMSAVQDGCMRSSIRPHARGWKR